MLCWYAIRRVTTFSPPLPGGAADMPVGGRPDGAFGRRVALLPLTGAMAMETDR